MATVVKEKTTSSSSLSIIFTILSFLITLIGAVITVLLFVFLYKRHARRSIGCRAYQVNGVAQRRNKHPTGANVQEEPITGPNGIWLRPPLLPPRQISTVSTRSYVSARSSATSFKWNIAYFLFKVFGTPGDTDSPVAPGPNDHTAPVTTFESGDRIERYDTDNSTSTAAHTVNVTTDAGLDFPHYVNVNYEPVGSEEQLRAEADRNDRPTTTVFNKGEYLRVL